MQTGQYVQHHQASQRAEGVVRNTVDVVQGERHGLQGGQLAQSRRRNLRQSVVVQPEVAQRAQAGEGAGRDAGDVIGIQTPLNRAVSQGGVQVVLEKVLLGFEHKYRV